MTDGTNLTRLIQQIKPDEAHNLAAMIGMAVSL
jgi:GDP-D-mannose dehydratase